MTPSATPDFRFSLWRAALLCFVVGIALFHLPPPFDGLRHVCDQAAFLVCSAWFIRRRGLRSADITGPLPSWRACVRWMGTALALSASILACLIMAGLLGWEPGDDHSPVSELVAFPLQLFLTASLVAPLTEELAFRGLLLRNLMQRVSMRRAVLLSAFVFAAIHLQDFGIAQFPMGLLLALAYIATRSLWLCAAMHAAMNALLLGVIYGAEALPDLDGPAASDVIAHVPHGPLWTALAVIAGAWIVLLTRWVRALPPAGAAAPGEPQAWPQPA